MQIGDFIKDNSTSKEEVMLYLGACSPASYRTYGNSFYKYNAYLYIKCTNEMINYTSQEFSDWFKERCLNGFEKGGFVRLDKPLCEDSDHVIVGHMSCVKDSNYVCNACKTHGIAYIYR